MQSTDSELWKPVVGYEGYYEVSDHGRVRSLDRMDRRGYVRPGRMMKLVSRETGHLWVGLCVSRQVKKRYVHALVLEAFVGLAPDGHVTCHNDGDEKNNRLSNLRWDTQRSNVQDEVRHGTHHNASKEKCPRGHRLTMPNLTASAVRKGQRACLACQRAWAISQYRDEPFSAVVADEKYRAIINA